MDGPIHYVDIALRVQFDPEKIPKLLEVARRFHQENVSIPATDDPNDETMRPMSDQEVAEEVAGADDVITELLQAHPLFEDLGVEIIGSCTREPEMAASFEDLPDLDVVSGSREAPVPSPSTEDVDHNDNTETDDEKGDDELDEFCDSGVFLCRWPNGEFSIVVAATKRLGIIQLDEWGAAEPEIVQPIDTCMLDFGLNKNGDIELLQMGEETADLLYSRCYPILDAFKSSDEAEPLFNPHASKEDKRAAMAKLRRVIHEERTRLWAGQSQHEARTQLGRDIQKRMRASSIVADHYAKRAARSILERFDPKDEKPQ